MLIDDNAMKADGLTDAEILKVTAHLHQALEVNHVDCRPAILFSVTSDSQPRLVSAEDAKALHRLQPHFWHVFLANGLCPYWARSDRVKRQRPEKPMRRSIDDMVNLRKLRRHPPTKERCWVCAKPWARYCAPIAQPNKNSPRFPDFPVIVVPIKKHLQRIAPGIDNIPDEIAVCFECFNEYATIYHHVLADLIAEG